MRYIAVFLLLVNLAYFGWNVTRPDSGQSERVAPRPLLNTGITLLEEYRRDEQAQQEINARSEQLCTLVSGFLSLDEAEDFLADARQAGYPGALQLLGEPLPSHFRAYLPPASSRTVATIILDGVSERLEEAALDIESYLITRGLLENAVALGVYDDEVAAMGVAEQLRTLGYEPVVEEIRRSDGGVEVWLRPPSASRINESEWLDFTAERPNLSRSENLCETLVQAPQFQ